MSSLPEGRRDIATGELITPERASAPPAPRGGGCARGCLIAFIVLLILVVVAAILISVYWRKLTTSVVRPLITQAVDALPLPADEVAEAKVVAGDLLDAWEKRAVGVDDIVGSLADLKMSPKIAALMLAALQYDDVAHWNVTDASPGARSPLGQSRLSEEERQRFAAASRRFVAALDAGMVAEDTMNEFWTTLAPKGGGQPAPGKTGLATQISDMQLRALLAMMESSTAGKSIPPATPVDPAEGMREVLTKLKALRDRVAGGP